MSEDIVRAYTTYDSIEADLIKAQLESEGISCFLKSDNAGGVLPQLTMTTGIEVMVRAEDKSKTLQIIKERKA